MKFITFINHLPNSGSIHTAVFSDAMQHSEALQRLQHLCFQTLGGGCSLEAEAAGSMRFNGKKFFDYSSSMTLSMGSGHPQTTPMLNENLKENKPFNFISFINKDVLVLDSNCFEKEDLEKQQSKCILGQTSLKNDVEKCELLVQSSRLLYKPSSHAWEYDEKHIDRRIHMIFNPY